MTMQQETRFRCDRCRTEISVPMNDQPALERGKPPSEWRTLWIGANTNPPTHLCPECGPLFESLMHGLHQPTQDSDP